MAGALQAPPTALAVFLGGFGQSGPERLVDRARVCATLDTIDAWHDATGHESLIVTDDPAVVGDSRLPPSVVVDVDAGEFHFGRRLAALVQRYGLGRVVALGGGSLPLLRAPDFEELDRALDDSEGATNNFFSSDLNAFRVTPEVLSVLPGVDRDNSLARALRDKAGMAVHALPRTVAAVFDIDAPTDLAVLKVAAGAGAASPGPRLSDWLESTDIDVSAYEAVLPLLTDQSAQILVAGRVGTHAWSYLEAETACRVRLFAEERGMEADGRAGRGEVRSLLALYLDSVGIEVFFAALRELCDAAVIDTRVILAHREISPSRRDRFLSDLGTNEGISDPFLAEFTRSAMEAPVRVLLGGHSLMSGGLMLLNETAWTLQERNAGALS